MLAPCFYGNRRQQLENAMRPPSLLITVLALSRSKRRVSEVMNGASVMFLAFSE